jgi:glycosyltransferase involved in cell wall biosynthesis
VADSERVAACLARHETMMSWMIPRFADPATGHAQSQEWSRDPEDQSAGEYLAAARPVVTTHVGEIDRYPNNRETAYVSVPGDAVAYAESIVEILDHTVAAAVGRAGRRLAEERFHYSLHGASLRAFVESLTKQ